MTEIRPIFIMIMAIAIVAMTSIMPLTTTPQIAKAETYCSQTYLTQQERYNCGYNRGYLDAQRDWNLNRGEDSSCPHATEHTPEYCNGYQIGYTTSWNAHLNQVPNPPTNYTGPHTTAPNLTPIKFLNYENSTYGIKMQYPSDWRVEGASNSSTVAWFYPQRNYTYIIVQMENLGSNFTLDQYRNAVIQREVANHKDFPDIEFTNNAISDVEFAGHPGYLLNGTFRDPVSGALQEFTNIGTIIGDKAYSVIYYSPVQTYPVYITTFSQMIASLEITPPLKPGNQTRSTTPAPSTSTTISNETSQNQTQLSRTQAPNPNPPTTTNQSIDWLRVGSVLLVIFLIIAAVWKLTHRGGKYKERLYFPDSVKEKVLDKQHHRCADCNRVLNVVDWHHKNGDRSDNRESNCVALCPNCHAIRTRRH